MRAVATRGNTRVVSFSPHRPYFGTPYNGRKERFLLTYDYLNTLYSDIMRMLSKLVIKREDEAHGAETAETACTYELYHACVTGSRYFL